MTIFKQLEQITEPRKYIDLKHNTVDVELLTSVTRLVRNPLWEKPGTYMVASGLARSMSYFVQTTFTLIDNSPFTTGYQSLMVRGLATYIRRLLRPNEIQIDVLPS